MKISTLQTASLPALLLCIVSAQADEMEANRILSLVERQSQQYGGIEVEPARGIKGNSGHFLSPYTVEGSNTNWLDEILAAKAEGGFECKKKSGSVSVPVVGTLMGATGAKSCEQKGMLKAAGGWDDIKDDSEVSFRRAEDMAVYMHALHHEDENYASVLSIMITLYPELSDKYQRALSRAQIDALRASRVRR